MRRSLVSVLVAVIVLVCSSTIPISADTYNISAPEVINLGDFNSAGISISGLTITATTDNLTTRVDITVKDTKANNIGFLTLGGSETVGATALFNPLQVSGGDQFGFVVLTGAGIPLASDKVLVVENLEDLEGEYSFSNFAVKQIIDQTDLSKTPGSYSLILTFTATFE